MSRSDGAKIQPVILAGGKGTRLWPFSTESTPKQFLTYGPIADEDGKSPLQQTLDRASYLRSPRPPFIVGNVRHFKHLEKFSEGARHIVEPFYRGTAPSVAMAAINSPRPDDVLLVLPSDHYIENRSAFVRAVQAGRLQAKNGWIVSLGVNPTFPSSDYGYICPHPDTKPFYLNGEQASFVKTFHEKPSERGAEKYISRGAYWNTGIFMVRADVLLQSLPQDIVLSCARGDYVNCPEESIDRALMEKVPHKSLVVELNSKWSDLGSWYSILSTFGPKYTERRKWGHFDVIYEGPYYKVKRIFVDSGKSLSLQSHQRRGEYWKVASGVALADVRGQGFILRKGEDVYVPRGAVHRLQNLSPWNALEVIEVQLGDYLGEDDIKRYSL